MCQQFDRLQVRLDRQDKMLEGLLLHSSGSGRGDRFTDPLQSFSQTSLTEKGTLGSGELSPGRNKSLPSSNQITSLDSLLSTDALLPIEIGRTHSNTESNAVSSGTLSPARTRRSRSEAKSDTRERRTRSASVAKLGTDMHVTFLQKLTRSSQFELLFGFLIMCNAVWIGFEVDYQARHPALVMPLLFFAVTHFFSFAFLIELLARMIAERTKFFFARKDVAWNIFDLLLVTSSMVDFALFFISQVTDLHVDNGPSNLQNLRLLRVTRAMRLLRLLRMARLLRLVRALRVLVHSIITTLKSLIWAMILLTIIIYVFAIMFTKAASDYLDEHKGCYGVACEGNDGDMWRLFGTIPRSMFTLYKSVSSGADWEICTDNLAYIDGVWVAAFIVYIAFVYFAVLNVVTGVFCQSAIESAQHDRELAIATLMENKEKHTTNIKSQFGNLFAKLDADESGTVSLEEFQEHMDDSSVAGFFILLDIDPSDAFALFKLLDDDGSGQIDADEFIDGCLRLQGGARSIDLAKVRHEHKTMLKKLHDATLAQQKRNDELLFRQGRQLSNVAAKVDRMMPISQTSPGVLPSDQISGGDQISSLTV